MKIGLLGGTFNPPHAGHLSISEDALKRFSLDEVWWVPSIQNPLKKLIAPPISERIVACSKLVSGTIKVKNIEEETNSTLTIKNVKYLLEQNPGSEFYFIMGSDNLIDFDKWDNWEDILSLIKIIVYERPGYWYSDIHNKVNERLLTYKVSLELFLSAPRPAWTLVRKVAPDISSTQIRQNNEKS